MRFSFLTAALVGAAAVAAPLGGALAADSFDTQLHSRTQLGPQVVTDTSSLTAGSEVRLTITATQDVTVSVIWQSSSGASRALLNDTRLKKGQSISVPGNTNWLALEAGQGVQSFQIFSTDAAGNVEVEQIATLVVDSNVALLDQQTFSSLSKASGSAQPVQGFSSGLKTRGAKAQPPTFATPSLPKQPQAPSTPSPAPTPTPAPEPQKSQEPQFYEIDIPGGGKGYAADTNGDGYYDIILVDENMDGTLDYALLDLNHNGTIDAMVIPTTDRGRTYDIWVIDENEDGVPDYYGFDWNQDGEIDEWQKA